MNSLRLRLLTAAACLLLVFLSLTGWALHNILNSYSEQAEYDRLQSVIYMLLSAFEINQENGVLINDDQIREIRLLQPESRLIATVTSNDALLWESTSITGDDQIVYTQPLTDEWQFQRTNHQASLSYGYEWVNTNDSISRFAITVTDSASPLIQQQQEFSNTLWRALLIIGVALLLLMFLLLSWGLAPLKKITSELSQIKKGNAEKLSDNFPKEIKPLTNSINRFISHEQKQITRFRNSLADLAHSLKTPLAVIKADPDLAGHDQVITQVDHIDKIIHHQLSRAAASGRRMLAEPIKVKPIAEKIIAALKKVYLEKNIEYNNDLQSEFTIPINEDDLTEVLGILLDNAAKYGATKVTLLSNDKNELFINDNGPGISDIEFETLIQRGIRGDTLESGTGIGLAIAVDIIKANSGTIRRIEKIDSGLKLELKF